MSPTDASVSPAFAPPPPVTGLGSFHRENLGRVPKQDSRQLLEVGEFSVTLSVGDIDRLVAWYCETFGFQVDRMLDFPDYGTKVIMARAGRVRIEFLHDATFKPFTRPDPPAHSSQQGATQIQFFIEDMDAFLARVKARPDIEIAWDVIDITGLRLKHFFIRDPEGNLIQISEPY